MLQAELWGLRLCAAYMILPTAPSLLKMLLANQYRPMDALPPQNHLPALQQSEHNMQHQQSTLVKNSFLHQSVGDGVYTPTNSICACIGLHVRAKYMHAMCTLNSFCC